MTQTYNVSATTTTQKHTGIHGLRGKVTAFFLKKKIMITEKGKTNDKAKEEETLLVQRDRRLIEPFVRRKPTAFWDSLNLSFGFN